MRSIVLHRKIASKICPVREISQGFILNVASACEALSQQVEGGKQGFELEF